MKGRVSELSGSLLPPSQEFFGRFLSHFVASTSSHTLISLVNTLPTFVTNFRYVKIIGQPHCLYETHLHSTSRHFRLSSSLTLPYNPCDHLQHFSALCSAFATPHDIFSIFSAMLQFIIVTSDIYRSSRPNTLSPLSYLSLCHHIQQKSPEMLHTVHRPPSTVPIAMPARGDHSALHLNPRQPLELCRYFADLTYHFTQSDIVDDQEKKHQACLYVDIDMAELWEWCPDFSNTAKSFPDFVHAIHRLYPGSDAQKQWCLQIWRSQLRRDLALESLCLATLAIIFGNLSQSPHTSATKIIFL